MGDAVRGDDVQAADPEQTIDAAQPRHEPARRIEVVAADYPQLAVVDRRHYVITGELAEGGMGRVLEARDLRLGRSVAIKELLPKHRDASRRFEREARITARLQHPSIIHVYEAGVWPGGEPFYAMPKVSGRSLDKVVADKQTFADRLALLPHVIAVADALAYAHNENVIHRDLKPANVLVGEFGETVVIDWGLAKDLGAVGDPKESMQLRLRASAEETANGGVVGTPAYMAPEQARGDSVDQRADVYALGALLYKVLAGVAPYCAANAKEVLELVKAGPPTPLRERVPDAPTALVAIVDKAMARDRDDRYFTASALAQDLKRFETGQLVAAHRYTIGELLRRWLYRHRLTVAIASIALVALALVGSLSVQRIVREKHLAELERSRAEAGRVQLLEEHGRAELLSGHAGAALAYLTAAAEDGERGGARGFLIADAMRPFENEVAQLTVGHGQAAFAVAPDGRHLVTGGAANIVLWTSEGTQLRSFPAHGTTRAVAIDDAHIAAGADDGRIRVWTIAGMLVVDVVHAGGVDAIALGKDGHTLYSAGDDGMLQIWDLATATSKSAQQCHSSAVISIEEAPTGAAVLTAGTDGIACVTDVHTGTIDVELRGHRARLNSAHWSSDSAYIITASDDGTARIWSASRGKLVVAPLAHRVGSSVGVALLTPDGMAITAGSDLDIDVWSLPAELPIDGTPASAKLVRTLVGHSGAIIAGAVDDMRLVTGGFDGLVKTWDLRTGQLLGTFEHADAVTAVQWVPGQMRVVSGSRDGTVRVSKPPGAKVHHELDSYIHAIAVSAKHVVACGRDDSRVTLADENTTRELAGHFGRVRGVAFTSDGTQLVSGGDDEAAIIWDVARGVRVSTLATGPLRALAIDGEDVVVLLADHVEVWSLSRGSRARVLPMTSARPDAIAIDATRIAAVGRDGSLVIWDRAGHVLTEHIDRATPYSAVTFASNRLITAGEGIAHVWRMDGHDVVRELSLEGPTGNVLAVAGDASRVITAGSDGRARIWSAAKGKLLGTRDYHERPVTGIALDGDTLWTASEDGTLGAWDVHIDIHHAAELATFMRAKHVVEHLDPDNVVRRGAIQ
jgi:WD40 repeat protein